MVCFLINCAKFSQLLNTCSNCYCYIILCLLIFGTYFNQKHFPFELNYTFLLFVCFQGIAYIVFCSYFASPPTLFRITPTTSQPVPCHTANLCSPYILGWSPQRVVNPTEKTLLRKTDSLRQKLPAVNSFLMETLS